jgi:hypothetical protein
MGEVYGPFPQDVWNLLSSMVGSRRLMRTEPDRYAKQIIWEKELTRDLLKKYS